MSNINLFRDRNFSLLFLSTIISGVGTGITLIGVSWVIIKEYNSSSIIAILTSITYIFTFLLLPKFSSLVDSYSRKNVGVLLFTVGAAVQFLIWLILLNYGLIISIIAISSIISSLIRTCDQVNRVALSQQLFSEEDYPILNSYLELARQSITFLAGGGASIIFNYAGLEAMIFCDFLTYMIGFTLLIFLSYRGNKSSRYLLSIDNNKDDNQKANSNFKETFLYLIKIKNLFIYNVLTLMPYVVVVSQNVIYPAHFSNFLESGPESFAFLAVPYGIGATLASIVSRLSRRYISSHRLILVCFILYTLSIPFIVLVPRVYITFCGLFIMAMTHATIRIERMTFLMKIISEKQMGRITGFFEMVALLFNIILVTVAGLIADNFGVRYSWFLFEAVMLIALIGLLLITPKVNTKRWETVSSN